MTMTGFRAQVDDAHAELDGEGYGPPLTDELRVDGTAQLGLFNAGGKQPTTATLTLAGKIVLEDGRAYRKGDRIHIEGVAVVRGLSQKDRVDKATGLVLECVQAHQAQVTDLVVRPAGVDGQG